MADLVVLVGRFKKTHRPMLERTLVTLRRSNAQVAGVVLNAVETHSSYYYDYYYYNHYYYATGSEPHKLPWIVGKVGEWRDVFKRSPNPKGRRKHRSAGEG
jgi:Mrp family chromosome partitioning ATPase